MGFDIIEINLVFFINSSFEKSNTFYPLLSTYFRAFSDLLQRVQVLNHTQTGQHFDIGKPTKAVINTSVIWENKCNALLLRFLTPPNTSQQNKLVHR